MKKIYIFSFVFVLLSTGSFAQLVINEGSNRNYSLIPDENGDYPDWIELYNAGVTAVNLQNYALTDDISQPAKWTFPNVYIQPGEFRTVFCSGKDRKPVAGFTEVKNTGPYTPSLSWNTHVFTTPFYWDGVSNILINTCSYSSAGYTTNSVFKQTTTSYYSTSFAYMDGSPGSCSAAYGFRAYQRPNMKLNNHIVGTGTVQNSPYDYPAPYGNWYWGARHQMLIRASELTAAGLAAGNITSLSFNVVSTDPNTVYDYIDINMKLVTYDEVPGTFEPVDPHNYFHTNFKISGSGETICLFSPSQSLVSQLFVNCNDLDNSRGLHPDGSSGVFLFQVGTPSASNNQSGTFTEYLLAPVFSVPSGFYPGTFSVNITDPNTGSSSVHYTLNGNEPSLSSPAYSGTPLEIDSSVVLKARAFASGILPSQNTVSTYLLGVSHTTPVISVVTDSTNLYGPSGIFDNWWNDWEKTAFIEYFDSTQNLVFSQRTGIQMDGGWGGARANPQHSFRCELDNGVLGDGPVYYTVIPDRPARSKYSQLYLRNGSNQYLVFPQKDACEAKLMGSGGNTYYSAWRPVSVYINGGYFGLYELREKIDAEYFETLEGADPDKTDILSLSAWNYYVLHATVGSVDQFYEDYAAFSLLDPADTSFWDSADQYFDLVSYTDYIIGESWIGNTDWPYNNIKIYRSDQTNYRWRFCLVDMELSLLPNGWTDCYFDHIQFMRTYDPSNPYVHIWQTGIQNDRYRAYFINRFADVMNTTFHTDNILPVEQNMYFQVLTEMPNEYARWGDPTQIQAQMLDFTSNHYEFHFQLSERTTQVRNHIMLNANLPNLVDVILTVHPEGAGTIHISTITPGLYPWQGVYFNGVPIRIEAVPAQGYNFRHWGDNGLTTDTLNAVFLDTLNTTSVSFDAYFEEWAVPAPGVGDPQAFSLYPNPAEQVLHVKNAGDRGIGFHYQVIDVNGRVVLEGTVEGADRVSDIPVGAIPPAVYILRITDSGEILAQLRFVKLGR